MRLRKCWFLVGIAGVSLDASQAWPQPPSIRESIASCNGLDDARYSEELQESFEELRIPTQINEARVVEADAQTPAYCQVSGYVTPSVEFLLRLPLEHWNGKLLKLGCGGLCGTTEHIDDCDAPLRRGYACMVSDGGHGGRGTEWMRNNTQAQIDLAYRSIHVAALAGKALVARYYGNKPRKSYFMGCSGGGRQAMMEAQRFPWDFDGIIAGAPAIATTGVYMTLLWNLQAFGDKRSPVLGRPEIELLHQAVLQQCDFNDGIRDGLIGDPRSCHFDPGTLRCSANKPHSCLSAQQLEAVSKIYGGPRTAAGERIYAPSALPGSERTWLDFPEFADFLAEQYGLLAHPGDAVPEKLSDFNFDRDYQRLGLAQALWEAVNPDLRKFEAAGGKLIMYTGWSDSVEGPLRDVDYYETVERVIGSRAATQNFFRLFVVPGMNHCTGGDGPFAIDYLSSLETWVEQGKAPSKLIGSRVKLDNELMEKALKGDQGAWHTLQRRQEFPLDPANVEFSRPIYPYPTQARYLGHGDPRDAASFAPVQP